MNLKRERIQKFFAVNKFKLLLCAIFISMLWPTFRSISIDNDFNVFFGAAENLVDNRNFYVYQYIHGYWYFYSVFFALILSPFTYFPIEFSKTLWSFVNLWFIYKIFTYAFQFSRLSELLPQRRFLILFVSWFMFYHLLYVNMNNSQVTLLILYLCLESYRHLLKRNNLYSGSLMATAINIKILPIVLVLPWILKKQYKSIVYGLVFFVFLLIVPMFFLDIDFFNELTVDWLKRINPFDKEHTEEVGEGGFIDLAGIVTKYFCSYKIRNEITLHWFQFSKEQLFITINALRLLIIGALFWITWKQEKNKKNKFLSFENLALWLAAVPLIIPHQRDYSILLLVPLITCLFYQYSQNNLSKKYFIFFIFTFFLMGMSPFLFVKNYWIQQWFTSFRIQGLGLTIFLCSYIIRKITFLKSTKYSVKKVGSKN